MNPREILTDGITHLQSLKGHVFDVLELSKPVSPAAAVNLAKIVSKLSPLVGNLIEFNSTEVLNEHNKFEKLGRWERQDPGFPDTVFRGSVKPEPGIEVKAWFPLSTEMTARFRDSQNAFTTDNIDVAILAWVPEGLIYGRPRIVDVCVVPALSVAKARDDHYHTPPGYLVIEPGDTSTRTRNLRQTNTAGYKWQGTPKEFAEALQIVSKWGEGRDSYQPTPSYQALCRGLMARYPYRLDTNYAKLDRIVHSEIEQFKSRVLATELYGMTVLQWSRLLCSENETAIATALETHLGIIEADADELLE